MKPKTLAVCSTIAGLLFSIMAVEIGSARKMGISSTTEVTIDDRSFRADESFSDERTLLRRELTRLGIRLMEPFDISDDSDTRNPVFSAGLVDSTEPATDIAPKAPFGLKAEHTLRMSGTGRTVDIAIGKMTSSGTSITARLSAAGWTPISIKGNPRLSLIYQKTRGKETVVVCLDEKESIFLLLRKLEK